MKIKYYVNDSGMYIGSSTDAVPPTNGIEVMTFPNNALAERWNGSEWVEYVPKSVQLANITVTTQAGNTFDGNETARNNMLSALYAAEVTGLESTNWKLADNSVVEVSLQELQEALTLSIQEVGRIVGATE